jgi:hypothetical protein
MTEKAMSESATIGGTFDEPWDVGNDEFGLVVDTNDSKIRLQRSERVRGNLGLRCRDDADQGALPCIRESHESDVSHQLQLEFEPTLLAMFALFGETRSTSTIRQESRIAPSPSTAVCRQPLVTRLGEIGEELSRVHVSNDGALRNLDFDRLATPPVQVLPFPVNSVSGDPMRVIAKCEKRCNIAVGDQPDFSTASAVAAVWSTHRDGPFATERDATRPAIACTHIQLAFIDELAHEHSSTCTLSVRA